YRCSLGLALHEDGQDAAAQEQYREAVRLDPTWPEAANRAARRLATDPEARVRDGTFALKLATHACQATAERQPFFLDTLAAAYAETGRYDDAVKAARKALALAPADLASK